MRFVLAVVALLVLSGLAPTAVAGGSQSAFESGSATGAIQTANQSVSGTVTYTNGSAAGNATVLVGSRALFEKSSPSELREVASGDPQDVAVAQADADGSYSLTVGENVDAEAIVAVSPDGVSRVQPFEAGTVDLTLRPGKTLAVETPSVRAEPGARAPVSFELVNTGDRPVEGLQVTLGKLPEGWNVADTDPGSATYSPSNLTFAWDTIEPGERVTAEMRVFVAIDADKRTYDLPVFADSESHPVEAGTLSVTVAYPTDEPSGTDVADDQGTGISVPGFGPVVAVIALLGAALAVVARRD